MEAALLGIRSAADEIERTSVAREVVDSMVWRIELASAEQQRLLLHTALRSSMVQLQAVSAAKDKLARKLEEERAAQKEAAREALTLKRQLRKEMKMLYDQLEDRAKLEEQLAGVKAELVDKESELQAALEAASVRAELMPAAAAHATGGGRLVASPASRALNGLKDELLLLAFSFLEAPDVLAYAQSSRSMYRRVDRLFGVGGSEALGGTPEEDMPKSLPPGWEVEVGDPARRSGGGGSGGSEDPTAGMTTEQLDRFLALASRVKLLEGQVGSLTAEREDLVAKMTMNSQMKEFLVDKLKEVEAHLARVMEQLEASKAQTASDQEVIMFLDGRVRELEMENRVLTEERDSAVVDKTSDVTGLRSRLTILEESLRVSQSEKEALEKQSKAQKKLLIKEVKSLRAELAKKQSEVDALNTSMHALKESVARIKEI
eukprot:PLAT5607.1.p2 GENE.PLAT5607.1~~PLAT5607.1.p2  ORF type:complete len:433 (-),score=191.44 PLAT5607.1:36-1334(-)